MKSKKYDSNLPRNLTFRKKEKTFYWRNPLTKKELSLGQISRREAVAQAIEANNYIAQNYTPIALIEKLKGMDSLTVTKWLTRYEILLKRRNLSRNTYKIRSNQISTIREKIGDMLLKDVSTRHIAMFLEQWTAKGKNTMAGAMRSVLSDIFREAIVEGHITNNPVAPTRAPKISVVRERLYLDSFKRIRSAAEQMPSWFPLAMDLALVTGQRREDIASMKFNDVYNERLHVTQIKTGMKIAIPLTLSLKAAGLQLGEVIERCQQISRTDFLISAGKRKNSPDGSIHPDGLTKKFVAARKLSGLKFSDNPPTFHELRSLSGRLYAEEFSENFAQNLLGHASDATTKLYLKDRDEAAFLML